MMRVLKGLLVATLVLVSALLVTGIAMDSNWEVRRSIVVAAPAEKILPALENLSSWEEWSTWNRREVAGLEMDYEGPARGVGASARWKFKGAVGVTEITQVTDRAVRYTVGAMPNDFRANGTIELSSQPEGTRINWTYGGNMGRNPLFKLWMLGYIHVVKKGFEESLSRLKKLSENA